MAGPSALCTKQRSPAMPRPAAERTMALHPRWLNSTPPPRPAVAEIERTKALPLFCGPLIQLFDLVLFS